MQRDFDKVVNHPPHYKAGNIEAIDVIESYGLGFHLGNAVKYILRAGRKTENGKYDIEKAIWYLKRYNNGQDKTIQEGHRGND